MDFIKLISLTTIAFIISITLVHGNISDKRYHGRRHKRQHGAHLYLPESYLIPNGEGESSDWSDWSSPSECSRSCGGGVSFQTRECLHYTSHGQKLCKGGSRKYFSCNTQDCPEEEPDFRSQQCSRFNSLPFDGVRYEWVPYTNAPNPCELNCMPRGERFYYRHKAKVIDGTRCNDKNLDVCVDGECQPVGCDMMLGSNAREDKCRKCGGDGSSCKTVSGIFETNNLAAGYNDILLIPTGATNIVINELSPSNNYLACRNLTGHYYLNGNWRIDFPRPMHYAGSWWHYQRKPTGFAAPDQLTCSGPTTEAIYIVLLIQDRNVGVQYEYSIPEVATKLQPDTYSWTHMEFGACSVTCGGGIQTRNVTCNNRLTLETVDESLCDINNKPNETQTCASTECPPKWTTSEWSTCSMSCGDAGNQRRRVTCETVTPNGSIKQLDDSVCLQVAGDKPVEVQECNRNIRNCPQWHIGPWSPCDKLCGDGKRRRKITCFVQEEGRKRVLPEKECSSEKPPFEESCIVAPCEGVDWIVSKWTGCNKCGQTFESRTAICGSTSGKVYSDSDCLRKKPDVVRSCTPTKCKPQWFTSPWSDCSSKCGTGVQSRTILCVEFDGTSMKIVDDETQCNHEEKPISQKECKGLETTCTGEWFTGPWSECSKSCGGGQRTREVFCLQNGVKATTCEESQIEFSSETCNVHPCTDDETLPVKTTSPFIEEEEDDESCEEDYDDYNFGEEVTIGSPKQAIRLSGAIKLAEGIDVDAVSTTVSSLITDELMLSDYPSTISETDSTDSFSKEPSPTIEGSGDDMDTTITSITEDEEGSGEEVSSTDATTHHTASTETTQELSSDSIASSTEDSSIYVTSTDASASTDESSDITTSAVSSDATEHVLSSTGSSPDTTLESYSSLAEEIDETSPSESTTANTDNVDLSSTFSTESSSTDNKESTPTVSTDSTILNTESSTQTSSVDSSSTFSISSTTESASYSPSSETDLSTDSTLEGSSTASDKFSTDSSETPISTSGTDTTETSISTFSTDTTETSISTSNTDTTETSISTSSTDTTETSISTSNTDTTETSLSTSSFDITETSISTSSTDASEPSISTSSTDASETPISTSSTDVSETPISTSSTDVSETPTSTETSLDSSSQTTVSDISSTTDYITEFSTDSSSDRTDSSTETSLEDGTSTLTESIIETTTSSVSSTIDEEVSGSTEKLETSESLSTSKDTEITTTSGQPEDVTESTPDLSTSSEAFDTTSTSSDTDITTDASPPYSDSSSPDLSSTDIPTTTEPISETSTDSTSLVEETTFDIWSSETTDLEEAALEKKTPNVLYSVLKRKSPRKCKEKKPKTPDCLSSKFGCCSDKKTPAKGPFAFGCKVIKTCTDSKFGCCADGLSPAAGPNYKGCPKSLCNETLFGCCPDEVTAAEGENNEGCPILTTISITTPVTTESDTESTSSEAVSTPSTQITDVSDITEVTDATTETSPTAKEACSDTQYGCCPDGETEARGINSEGCTINEEDCSKSRYGCCQDNKLPAYGPNYEGCQPCRRERFGCCPDGITPSHGPLHEGCCLKTPFGCCPDNINAARGPNFQDCGCQYTPYGCCPDNSTAARGYNAEGCPCETTKYGCCPDKLTPATGDKFEGCPCHTMQFGCCPDGITIPQGPHRYGCHCSQTEFKCCPDDKTPARGPNFEGCTCAESKFGCCPDGVTEAQGKKFEGCEIRDEIPQKACGLPKDRGTCSNFTIKYFFDTSYGACARFWYGGCNGNGNRFETKEECRTTCQDYEGKNSCLLPKSAGPCPGSQKKWYYNADRSRCEEFNYGGCYGTSNRFNSLEECQAHCSVAESFPPCEQPMDPGPCQGNFERWYYDNNTDVCHRFAYGGCKGNKNNYATEKACNYNCKQSGTSKELCSLPSKAGNCEGNHARWYFSDAEQKCLPFYYTGCGGNKNNFQSLESCEQHCPKAVVKDVCEIAAEVGECQNYTPRWYWDTKDKHCRQFYYGGCGGNGNNFIEENECKRRCEARPEEVPPPPPQIARIPDYQPANLHNTTTSRPDSIQKQDESKCFYPSDAGNCDSYIARWFYNTAEGVCDQFIYTGCGGNANNFATEEECEDNCFHIHSTCSLPPIYGRCKENTTRWHYDEPNKRCFEFEFSGCRGNRNNFFTEQECMDYCQNANSDEDTNVSTGRECDLRPEVGNCQDKILSWYFNKENGQCERFYFSGCNGNANRFESQEKCEHHCRQDRRVDPNLSERPESVPTNNCTEFEEKCRQLHCPYGTKTQLDVTGCTICECIDPCSNYSCSEDEKCVVDISNDVSSEVRFTPICRLVQKPGICPSLSNSSSCRTECYDDADCRADNKCCVSGCSHVCTHPQHATELSTTTSPPPPRRNDTLPGETPVVLEAKTPAEVEVTSSVGGVAILRCFATGNPAPLITWRRGAIVIDTNKGRYILTSAGDLAIIQVQQTDNGTYICVASNGIGIPVSREVNLQVSDHKKNIPAYMYGPKNVTQIVTLKSPATIRCPAGGHPKPHVNWWRGKNRMPLTTAKYDTRRDFSLVFRSIELSDLGSYECSAWTGHGKPASITVVLKTIGPVHEVEQKDKPFLRYVIEPVAIATSPKPTTTDISPSYESNVPQVVDLEPRFGLESHLTPSPPYGIEVRASALIRRDSSNNYTVGSDIVLNCDVEGYPAPNVTWTKDSQPLSPSTRIQITEKPYRLVIYRVTVEDSGYYGCTARNTFSFNTSEERILIESGIYVRPDCTDNKYFANCALIVKGRYCSNIYYAKFCCRSCTLAGQLPGGHPNAV